LFLTSSNYTYLGIINKRIIFKYHAGNNILFTSSEPENRDKYIAGRD